jgi:endonuclease YncB( thermonuclease family)
MNYHCGRSAPEKRQIKVRLTEIDAPEKSQAFGQRSKQSLSDLVFDKQIRVEQQDIDRYGRVVGRVYAGGLNVNAEQIRRGMAWVYRQYNRDKSLLALEQEAKNNKRGLWSEPNPVPPWEYRHGGRAGPPAGIKSAQALARLSQLTHRFSEFSWFDGCKVLIFLHAHPEKGL